MAVAAVLFFLIKDNIGCVSGFPVFKQSKKEAPQKTIAEIPAPIKAYKVARVSFRDTLPGLGTVRGFRQNELKFQVSGLIEYINFKEGEKITQGDIIASLDQKEAMLKLEYAKVELDKQTKLFELGAIIETKLKQSEIEYESAKQELEKTNLLALSDGYMGSLEVDRGSFVTPQDKICTFVDIKDVYIEFGVIEKDAPKVREGQNVEVVLESYPDQVFKGVVDSVSPVVEGRTRTMKVRAKISNPDERMKAGMFGRVNVLVYEKEDAMVIPSSSFKKKEDKYFVYVVHPDEAGPAEGDRAGMLEEELTKKTKKRPGSLKDKKLMVEEPKKNLGVVEMRTIEISYATPEAIEIKEGLEDGELVIVDVEQEFQDKAKVEITETQEGIF